MTSVNLYIILEMGARNLYIDKTYTALDIFCFVVFSILKTGNLSKNREGKVIAKYTFVLVKDNMTVALF